MFDLFFISFYYHNRISNHNIKKKILGLRVMEFSVHFQLSLLYLMDGTVTEKAPSLQGQVWVQNK